MPHPNRETGLPCYCGWGERKILHQFTAHQALPWEPGEYGKGLYFPDHDHLVTWGDARSHQEVRFDDDNGQFKKEYALDIHPDGHVLCHGDPDEAAEDAIEAALKREDPKLRLDRSISDWSITEPTPTSPEYENQYGLHDVQISNDWDGFPG